MKTAISLIDAEMLRGCLLKGNFSGRRLLFGGNPMIRESIEILREFVAWSLFIGTVSIGTAMIFTLISQ